MYIEPRQYNLKAGNYTLVHIGAILYVLHPISKRKRELYVLFKIQLIHGDYEYCHEAVWFKMGFNVKGGMN